MKLTIKNLQHGDFGNYRCISKNSLGETEGSIRVYGDFYLFIYLVIFFLNENFIFFFWFIEIPLPSTPAKQITHVIAEIKERKSDGTFHIYINQCFCFYKKVNYCYLLLN